VPNVSVVTTTFEVDMDMVNHLTLPYFTFGADDTLRRHPALRPSDGPIVHPRKAKG